MFFGEYDFIWELVSKANELDCDVVVAFLFGDDVMVNSNSGMVFWNVKRAYIKLFNKHYSDIFSIIIISK